MKQTFNLIPQICLDNFSILSWWQIVFKFYFAFFNSHDNLTLSSLWTASSTTPIFFELSEININKISGLIFVSAICFGALSLFPRSTSSLQSLKFSYLTA